ncbi:MAG: histidine kinase dimerization/phospho-acceptor domain-containing protein [Bacteroidales bacterium]
MDQEREHIGGLPCMDGEEAQDRIENLLEVMGQVIQGDYTAQARMSGTNDEFDALAMGLNMMIDELQENLDLQEQNERIRELNSEVVEAKNRAQESDRLKSAFLANMSHEIRTPMNAIVGFSSLLLRGGRDPKSVHQYLTFIDNAAKHLLDLINDILDLSKIDAGELKIDIREHKLNRLLRDVMELESQDQRLKEKKT